MTVVGTVRPSPHSAPAGDRWELARGQAWDLDGGKKAQPWKSLVTGRTELEVYRQATISAGTCEPGINKTIPESHLPAKPAADEFTIQTE